MKERRYGMVRSHYPSTLDKLPRPLAFRRGLSLPLQRRIGQTAWDLDDDEMGEDKYGGKPSHIALLEIDRPRSKKEKQRQTHTHTHTHEPATASSPSSHLYVSAPFTFQSVSPVRLVGQACPLRSRAKHPTKRRGGEYQKQSN